MGLLDVEWLGSLVRFRMKTQCNIALALDPTDFTTSRADTGTQEARPFGLDLNRLAHGQCHKPWSAATVAIA